MTVRIEVPLTTVSAPNRREHWAVKAKRVKKERDVTRRVLPRKWPGAPVLVVRLTRCSPRELDSDNLAGALKGIRDQVASWLRIDDGSSLVEWRYSQEHRPATQGLPGVRVECFRWEEWQHAQREEMREAIEQCMEVVP